MQSRIQGFGGGSSDSISSTSSRGTGGGLGGSSATGSSRMTGFGNPKLEGSAGASTGGVTSPKSLLGSIGGKAGFGSTTRHAPFMTDEVWRKRVLIAPACHDHAIAGKVITRILCIAGWEQWQR